MDQKVLLEALGRPWYMEPDAAAYYAAIVHRLVMGEPITEFSAEEKKVKEFAFVVNAASQKIGTVQDAVDNGVAVINLRGAIMKYDYCGSPGTQSIIKTIQDANNNPAINSIVLQIDSPGGSVDGTQQLANAVKNSDKPVVAYINGKMASAAMWIGSAAQTRIASSNTDIIGSIGTMASWNDYKGYYEKIGIKSHEVYATASTHKNLDFREASSGNYEPLIKNSLDPLNNEFIDNIKSNLPNADPTVFNGAHYIAKDAKKKGLVDKIGTFESAVKTAMQLGKQQQQAIKTQHTKMAFEKTLKASKSESFEVVEGGFLLSEDQLNNIEAHVAAQETTNADTQAQLEASQQAANNTAADLKAANETIAARDARITELEAANAELSKGPKAAFTSTAKEGDETHVGASKNPFQTSVDEEAMKLRQMMKK